MAKNIGKYAMRLNEMRAGNAGFGNYVNYNNVAPGWFNDVSYVGASVSALDRGFYGEEDEDAALASDADSAQGDEMQEDIGAYPCIEPQVYRGDVAAYPKGFAAGNDRGSLLNNTPITESASALLRRIDECLHALSEGEVGVMTAVPVEAFATSYGTNCGFLREEEPIGPADQLDTPVGVPVENSDPDVPAAAIIAGRDRTSVVEALRIAEGRIKAYLGEDDTVPAPAAQSGAGGAGKEKETPEQQAKKRDILMRKYAETEKAQGKAMSPAMKIFNAVGSSAGFAAGEGFANWIGNNGGLIGKAIEILLSHSADKQVAAQANIIYIAEHIYRAYHNKAAYAELSDNDKEKLEAFVKSNDVSDIMAQSDKTQLEKDAVTGKTTQCYGCYVYQDGANFSYAEPAEQDGAGAEDTADADGGDATGYELVPYVGDGGDGGNALAPTDAERGKLMVNPEAAELETIEAPLGIEAKGLTPAEQEELDTLLPAPLPNENLVKDISNVEFNPDGIMVSYTDSNGEVVDKFWVAGTSDSEIERFASPKELTDYIMSAVIGNIKAGGKGGNRPRKDVTPQQPQQGRVAQQAGEPVPMFNTAGKQVVDVAAESLERRIGGWLRRN